MGCKFSFKRVFLVASLALAGLFGISSVVVKEQVNEISNAQKAEAALPSTIYISIDHNQGWNCRGDGTWFDTKIRFFENDDIDYLYKNPSTNILSQLSLSPGAKQVDDDYYASVTVPGTAKAFIIWNNPGFGQSNKYSYPQLIPDSSTQLNVFKIDTNSGTWQKGYWSYYNNSRANEIYVDRKGSSYATNYLALVFYRFGSYYSNSKWYDYEVVGSNGVAAANKLSFSSTCYGGIEYSDSYDINTKMSSFNYKSIISFDVYYSTNGSSYSLSTIEDVFLPKSSAPLLFTMNDKEWSSSTPERIKLIADASSPQDWYSNINNIYDKSKEGDDSIKATFKTSVGGSDVSVPYLEPITINGNRYGCVTVPFGAEAVNLYGEKAWANCEYSIDLAIPSTRDGRKYVFMRTTTNYRNAETEWVGGSNQLAEFVADPFRYTVTYHGDYGSNPTSYVWGVGATLTDPTKTGYTFHGFHYSSTYEDSPITSISKNETGDLDIYAEWTINTYTINWKDWDGAVLETDVVEYGQTPYYNGRTPHRDQSGSTIYTFNGWSTEVAPASDDVDYVAQYLTATATPKDKTIFIATGGSIGTNWYTDCDIAVYYYSNDLSVKGTIGVTKLTGDHAGFVTIPGGADNVMVLRLKPNHKTLPADSILPDDEIYNKYDPLELTANRNVLLIDGWDSNNEWWQDNQDHTIGKVILPEGMPIFAYNETDFWFSDSAVTKIYYENAAGYGLSAASGFVEMTRVADTNYLYYLPTTTIIADRIQIQRIVNGSWANGTTDIKTQDGYYNTCIVDIEQGKSGNNQNWGPKGVLETIEAYGVYFLNTVTCDGGETLPGGWSGVQSIYEGLSVSVQGDIWKTHGFREGDPIQQAMYRYDYIVFYKQYTGYGDFIGRSDSDGKSFAISNIRAFSPFNNDNNASFSTVIIIIASSVSLLSITALSILLVKKRKSKEQ